MRYKFYEHQGKGAMYNNALKTKYEEVHKKPVDFVFTDQAILGRIQRIEKFKAHKHFLYPHSGRPNLACDIVPMWKGIDAEFVATEAHKEIMRLAGHDKPIHVVGWSLCEIRPFQPKNKAKNVLFAPIHGRCHEMDKQLNRIVFGYLKNMDINLTVRYIHSLEESGLTLDKRHNITYFKGNTTPSTAMIDEADVVVGHQTFGYLGVARGIPTVMFGEDMKPHFIPREQPPLFPKNWDKYSHLLRYPLDFQDAEHPTEMIKRAIEYRDDVYLWKERMIGKQFSRDLFMEKLEKHL